MGYVARAMTFVLMGASLSANSLAGCMSSNDFYKKTEKGQEMLASALKELKVRIDEEMQTLGLTEYELEITRPEKMTKVNANGYGHSQIFITAKKDGIEYKTKYFDRGSIDAFKPTGWNETNRDMLGNTVDQNRVCFYQLAMRAPIQLWNTKEKVAIPFDVVVIRDHNTYTEQ